MNQINIKRTLLLLLLPGSVFLLFFFVLPLIFVFTESFHGSTGELTLLRYTEVLKSKQFHFVYLRTLKIALIVTPLAVLVAYPSAYIITKMTAGKKSVMMSLVILPLMTSPVARTFAWIVILGRFGLINQTLAAVKVTSEPLRLMYTEGAIVAGLLQLFMPIMVLTLVSALENIPEEVEEAALSLGSGKTGTFFRVLVPLSFDGLIMGVTLVFTGCITAYVTPAILGGSKVLTLSTLMRQEALVLMNWEGATVIAVIMIVTTLVLYNTLRLMRPRSL
ncbi:MAG: ABC transporter permease [Spirochaetia bacterium]|jgi:putative spermidine/putrescine transport system permease protein|nr:ABC transporter permease [Spirochaetia bacterium]